MICSLILLKSFALHGHLKKVMRYTNYKKRLHIDVIWKFWNGWSQANKLPVLRALGENVYRT